MNNNYKLILGTVQFGLDYGINNSIGKPSEETVAEILDTAYSNNVRFLDTAEAYGDSQDVIGRYHKNSNNKFDIITKYSSSVKELPKNLIERINKNLEKLNVDHLYGYMFHSFNDFENHFHQFKNDINYLKEQGIIKKFGVSVYTNEEVEELLKHTEVELIQIPFNLLDNSKKRASILQRAKEKGIEIHTRSVFLQGLFFKPLEQFPSKLAPLKKHLESITHLTNTHQIDMADIALNYACQKNYIDKVLIGVDNVDQLNENLSSINQPIPEAVINNIDILDVENVELLNPSNWN